MENATKALEMAAGVLMALLVLGLIVFAYNNVASLKNTQQDATKIEQSTDFNKDYEAYNKEGIYGSELLSLANKMEDYNSKYKTEDGYEKIDMSIDKITPYVNGEVFKYKSYSSYSDLKDNYNILLKKINNADITKKGKKISYWANSSSELKSNFNETTNPTIEDMNDLIKTYRSLVDEQTDIARKTFECKTVEYDKNNGRITKMSFVETES